MILAFLVHFLPSLPVCNVFVGVFRSSSPSCCVNNIVVVVVV